MQCLCALLSGGHLRSALEKSQKSPEQVPGITCPQHTAVQARCKRTASMHSPFGYRNSVKLALRAAASARCPQHTCFCLHLICANMLVLFCCTAGSKM